MKKILYFLFIAFLSESFSQQDSLQQPVYELPTLIVKTERSEFDEETSPFSKLKITSKELNREFRNLNLSEVISTAPGVTIEHRNNPSFGERISVRGIGSRSSFGVRGVRLYIDNIPLTTPDGQSQLNNIDLSSAGNIEIIKGGQSVLYGNASGGVININSQDISSRHIIFEPGFMAGAFDTYMAQGKISGSVGIHSYLVNVTHTAFNGHREHSAGKFTRINVLGSHRVLPNLRFTSLFNYYNAPYLLSPGTLSKQDLNEIPQSSRFFNRQQASGKKISQGQGGLSLNFSSGRTEIDATVFVVSRSLLNPVPGRIIDLSRTSYGFRSIWRNRFDISDQSLFFVTLGFDTELMMDVRREYRNLGLAGLPARVYSPAEIIHSVTYGDLMLNQDEKVSMYGPFAEFRLILPARITLSAGVRYDHSKFTVKDKLTSKGSDYSGDTIFKQANPVFGISWRPIRQIKLYANYSSSFQTPTTTELSNRAGGERGFNPNLKPEKLIFTEGGMRSVLFNNSLILNTAFFRIELEDMLVPYQLSSGSEEIFYRNAAKAENIGAEIGLSYRFASDFSINGAYTFMNFEYKDFLRETTIGADSVKYLQIAGNKVPGIAPHSAALSVLYDISPGSFVELIMRWKDKFYANDLNGPVPGENKPLTNFINDSYLTIDIKTSYKIYFEYFNAFVFAGINNIFDTKYSGSVVPNAVGDRFFEPAAGREWYAGLRIQLPGAY